jgi:hypothetical protein
MLGLQRVERDVVSGCSGRTRAQSGVSQLLSTSIKQEIVTEQSQPALDPAVSPSARSNLAEARWPGHSRRMWLRGQFLRLQVAKTQGNALVALQIYVSKSDYVIRH